MNNDNNTILGFDVNLICDFFLNTERQGPGSPEVTLKALSFIDNLTDKSLIADLGCGTGGQTMILAQHDLQRPDDFFCRMLVTSFGLLSGVASIA